MTEGVEEIDSYPEPSWVAKKAELDSCDDGHGPYMAGDFLSEEATKKTLGMWDDFKAWAFENLGQGYSLACCEGMVCDQTTMWAFEAYLASRDWAA